MIEGGPLSFAQQVRGDCLVEFEVRVARVPMAAVMVATRQTPETQAALNQIREHLKRNAEAYEIARALMEATQIPQPESAMDIRNVREPWMVFAYRPEGGRQLLEMGSTDDEINTWTVVLPYFECAYAWALVRITERSSS